MTNYEKKVRKEQRRLLKEGKKADLVAEGFFRCLDKTSELTKALQAATKRRKAKQALLDDAIVVYRLYSPPRP